MDEATLLQKPADVTPFPFKDHVIVRVPAAKRQKVNEISVLERYDTASLKPAYALPRPRKQINQGERASKCWFCMSSSICEIHMIITIGTHFYMAVAKGAINTSHILLIPIKHVTSTLELTDGAVTELITWKRMLVRYFSDQGEVILFYEHNQPPGNNPQLQHMHIQAIALPNRAAGILRENFDHEAGKVGATLEEVNIQNNNLVSKLREASLQSPYFWVHLPNDTHLVTTIDTGGDAHFPFSFGRRVLAKVLGDDRLENWKSCVVAKGAEEAMAKDLRAVLQPLINALDI